MAERTIKALNLGLSYFIHGKVKTIHLYKTAPFNILIDSSHPQLTGVEYFVDILDSTEFTLRFKSGPRTTYDVQKNRKNSKLKTQGINHNRIQINNNRFNS